jgi:hypothetical protein
MCIPPMNVLWSNSSDGNPRPAPLGGGQFFFAEVSGMVEPDRPTGRKHSPGFPTVPIALRIAFCALAIVLAPAAFRSPAQGLAL